MLIYIFLLSALMSDPLELEIVGVEQAKGHVRIAIYDSSDSHMDEESIAYFKEVAVKSTGNLKVSLNLPEGRYSIAVYHDVNDDKNLNTNLVGIPKELFGFSNNVMGTFGPPSFEEASIRVPSILKTSINLR